MPHGDRATQADAEPLHTRRRRRRTGEPLAGPPLGFWKDSWIRLKKNRGALFSLAVIVVLFAMAFALGSLVSAQSLYAQDLFRRFASPSAEFWFGTDEFGRDMWTRVWAGTRVSLYIGLLAALPRHVRRGHLREISGFLGGHVDDVTQRGIEVLKGSLPW